ncbi:MAG TPA: DUF1295 domain-containing protein [Oceanipulchritudo sp.]|nr:DUF1295 domain-containing protein [Oceanipulchritudo sp.]
MTETALIIFAGWAMVATVMFLLWRYAMSQGNAGWVDFGWGFTLVLLVVWYAAVAEGAPWRRVFFLLLTGLWGVRLTIHILQRLLADEYEDPRYMMLRRHWGESAIRKFFFFFQAQGLANLILTAPILLLMNNKRGEFSLFDLLGAAVIVAAVIGETIADRQLLRWRENPENHGRTCRKGLWAVSRHPNYFFEWVHWLGYPVLGGSLLGTSMVLWWPLTLVGPVLMLILLLGFTGIPYTEKQALKSRGEDYRKYQREVSAFIPWFPRKPAKDN